MPSVELVNGLAERLAQQQTLVLDGAMATELEQRGCDLNDPLWSARVLIEQPELIRAVHLDYLKAGADIITSASYQATFQGFARRGYDHAQSVALMQRSITLALEARDEFWADPANRVGRQRPLVAASVGPYGAMLADGSEYRGHYGLTIEQLMDFHRERLAIFLNAGADLLACETLPCPEEAIALGRLLAEEFPQAAAWISFSCRDAHHVSQGERLDKCLAQLAGFAQIVAVRVNCSAPEFIDSLLDDARAASAKPLLVYPNSGETYDPTRKCWHGSAGDDSFARMAATWHQHGARLIGGCCRTTPADIRAVTALLRPH